MAKIAFALVALIAVTLAAVSQQEIEDVKAFKDFMRQYNKQYSTSEELHLRFTNFRASLAIVKQKNSDPKNKATYGITKFADLSADEFKNTVLMTNPITVTKEPRDPSQVLPRLDIEVPNSWDWRDLGAVTAVKNQEQCGSCWAFSATENIESVWILAKKGTNETVDLAPQQIVDCDASDSGCDGGEPSNAFNYVISAGGMDSENDYPYTGEDGNCAFNKSSVVATISSWKYATSDYSESELQTNLVGYGPLSICVDAANWQYYTGGVMTWYECAWLNQLDHCVQLVGYNAETSNSYWIVRNSWGTDWGLEGYILLEMGEDTCGLTYAATTAVV